MPDLPSTLTGTGIGAATGLTSAGLVTDKLSAIAVVTLSPEASAALVSVVGLPVTGGTLPLLSA